MNDENVVSYSTSTVSSIFISEWILVKNVKFKRPKGVPKVLHIDFTIGHMDILTQTDNTLWVTTSQVRDHNPSYFHLAV